MVIPVSILSKLPVFEPNAACIGFFDGVHRGHQQLIRETLETAKRTGVEAMLITFDPFPAEMIGKERIRKLTVLNEKIRRIEACGIDRIIVFDFDETLMKMSAERFVADILNQMSIQTLICGEDFTFGYRGLGDAGLLKESGDFECRVIPLQNYHGKKISSSRIRNMIEEGRFRLADRLLGYEYQLTLNVTKCTQKGGKYVIEAVSKEEDLILPKDGSYRNGLIVTNGIIHLERAEKEDPGSLIRIRLNDYE